MARAPGAEMAAGRDRANPEPSVRAVLVEDPPSFSVYGLVERRTDPVSWLGGAGAPVPREIAKTPERRYVPVRRRTGGDRPRGCDLMARTSLCHS